MQCAGPRSEATLAGRSQLPSPEPGLRRKHNMNNEPCKCVPTLSCTGTLVHKVLTPVLCPCALRSKHYPLRRLKLKRLARANRFAVCYLLHLLQHYSMAAIQLPTCHIAVKKSTSKTEETIATRIYCTLHMDLQCHKPRRT